MDQSEIIKSAERKKVAIIADRARSFLGCYNEFEDQPECCGEDLSALSDAIDSLLADPLASTHEVPVGEQRIQFLEKALEAATEGHRIEVIDESNEKGIYNGWRHKGKAVILHTGACETSIEFFEGDAPELWAYLKEKAIPIPNTDGAVGLQEQG